MQDIELSIAGMGEEPPLIADGRAGPPDRREISARWLSGTFLTGLTSSVLMGVALFAALDGREQLATPPEIARIVAVAHEAGSGEKAKTDRLSPPRAVAKARDKRRMEVSTVTKVGDRDVVRMVPFIEIKMALAAGHTTNRPYPPFSPREIFAEDGAEQTATTGLIYGAKVDSEVSLKSLDFPIDTANFDENTGLSTDEVEKVVRTAGAGLTDGDVRVEALHYIDPQRFGDSESLANGPLAAQLGVHIVQENVSIAQKDTDADSSEGFAEDLIPFTEDKDITQAFADSGYAEEDARGMADAIAKLLDTSTLKAGSVLRVGVETKDGRSRIVRTSVYDHTRHLLTIALDDRQQYVPADEPEPDPDIATAFDTSPPVSVRGDLPTIYDGIYRSAYSYGMSERMTKQLIKILASDVDFQSRLSPADRITVLFSQPDEDGKASDESELLYANATFGGTAHTYYRFQMKNGSIDYFDQDGKSARQFLFRNPAPGARISRGFGMERHPILGIMRMHTGVDYATRRGTPILAAGNGVVEKVGWASGYGKETVIRHANGYETLYAHQSAFASGIEPGDHVRQGQVIGYVGSTGLSTGPHVHFEIRINDRPVDPLRVRLPVGHSLKEKELVAFKKERDRIDALLKEEDKGTMKVASQS
ncbi:M23 family metallopeptidase [Mesorhizobium koreense]|jgi:murein DD-endopeptidase MepM/ murein hydrolase activator NlpD|uniref:M23 family metallopeptidase n=1 Tax=Mesorhizobium koreense TaxID=3074855 RepID=UPI00287B7E29|nr:M23 family metallopeptidase [Mesorhizobium sp. WR6]